MSVKVSDMIQKYQAEILLKRYGPSIEKYDRSICLYHDVLAYSSVC